MTLIEDHIPIRTRPAIYWLSALLFTGSMLLAGCGRSGGTNEAPTTEDLPSSSVIPTETSQEVTPPKPDLAIETTEPLPTPVDAAINLAIEEFDVEPIEVTLLSYSEQNWPSTALGCPEPGQLYAQVITSGYLVKLSVAGQEVNYHTNLGSVVFHCKID